YRYYSLEELYSLKYLFHFETNIKGVIEIKETLFKELASRRDDSTNYIGTIQEYCDYVIKPKVFSLNKYLDKQLIMETKRNGINIVEDDYLLTKGDLNKIYREVIKMVIKNGLKLYKDAYWNGINDRV